MLPIQIGHFPAHIPHEGFDGGNSVEAKTKEISTERFKGNDDFGHVVHKKYFWTFFPSTTEQIFQIVKHANEQRIPIACRGRGHSTFGQAQVESGIVIDLRNFNHVYPVENQKIRAESGATWKKILEFSLPEGLSPPVLTDYLGLSVGGVLSVGGLGGQAHQKGTVADNVVALKILTSNGEIHDCSPTENVELFYHSLATLGQFSIILEATIQLDQAPQLCDSYSLFYDDLSSFLEDQASLIESGMFEYLEGQILHADQLNSIGLKDVLPSKKEWYFMIEAVRYQKSNQAKLYSDPPQSLIFDQTKALGLNDQILEDLVKPVFSMKEEKSFSDFIHRLKQGIQFFKSNNSWYQYHPWVNLFLPGKENTMKIVRELMESITLEDVGGWPILIYPVVKSKFTCPYFKVPEDEIIWVLDILRHAPTQEGAKMLIEKNKILYKKAFEVGGTMYPVGAISLDQNDWKKHFGALWPSFEQLKKEYDPLFLLGKGLNIFQ